MEVITLGQTWWALDQSGSSHVVRTCGKTFLFDCGKDATTNLGKAGINPAEVDYLIFTHHHWDHNLDFVHFMIGSWIKGRARPLRIFGPSGTAELVDRLIGESGLYARDIAMRARKNYFPLAGIRPVVRELDGAGPVLDEDGVRVTACRSTHVPDWDCLAYRVDSAEGSVVISGDTTPNEDVVRLAAGADILLHDTTGYDEFIRTMDPTEGWLLVHSSARQVGEIAARARVKKLICVHLQSELYNAIDRQKVKQEVSEHFRGEVLVADACLRVSV